MFFDPGCDAIDGGTSASRSAGTPRQGNDSSKIHPHREGQRHSLCRNERHTSPPALCSVRLPPFAVFPGLSPRNSLEVLTPEIPGERDRGNCITSLQLHPKGWATLIRCSSNMDDQEVRRSARLIADLCPTAPGFRQTF